MRYCVCCMRLWYMSVISMIILPIFTSSPKMLSNKTIVIWFFFWWWWCWFIYIFRFVSAESVVALFLFLYCLFVCYLNNISLFIAYSLWSSCSHSHSLCLCRTFDCAPYLSHSKSAVNACANKRLSSICFSAFFFPQFFIHPFLKEQILF